MQKITNFLRFDQHKSSTKTVLILIALAWIFGIAIRMIWVYQHQNIDQYRWADQMMINTNDGYYWAEGARDLLEKPAVVDELSPTTRALPIITAIIAKIVPFIQFETLILYLPTIFGSLLVVPIILIAHSLKHTYLGFVSALLAVIAHSYYNRTMTGYFDDDMLVIVLPMMVLWAMIWGVRSHSNSALFTLLFASLFSHWYYPGSYSLHISMSFMLLLYTLLFHRKDLYNYKLFALSLIAVAYTAFLIKLIAGLLLLFLFIRFKNLEEKYIYILAGFSFVFVLLLGGFSPIVSQLNSYVFRTEVAAVTENLHFYNVVQTVREAGSISFERFADRISGHTAIFVFSFIGLLIMFVTNRITLLALPFVGLGFLAYGIPGVIAPAGLRFTIYAVPILALGFGFFIFWLTKFVQNRFIKIGSISALLLLSLLPNINHIINYRMPTVFNSFEVKALNDFAKIVEARKDYAISWWDFGYPIRYYSFAKTLADGGKHAGDSNFSPSFILSVPNQLASARLARLATEYTEKEVTTRDRTPIIKAMMNDYNYSDANDFLADISRVDKFGLPQKTRETYLVLPYKMSDIFPTVMLFSNIDLMSGRSYNSPLFISSQGFKDSADQILMANGAIIHKQKNQLQLGKQVADIRYFVRVEYQQNGTTQVTPQLANPNGKVSIIFFPHLQAFWIADETAFNSTFVQLFALNSYDPNLFELVVDNPLMKIYRMKL